MKNTNKLSRKDYKAIKSYNNEQMTRYLEEVYRKAWTKGFNAGKEYAKTLAEKEKANNENESCKTAAEP